MFSIFSKKVAKYFLKTNKEVDNMNRNKAALYIFLCFSILSVLFTQLFFSTESKNNTDNDFTYILREYEGKIAVYREDELIDVTDISTKFLPENDRRDIENGIEISSRQELFRLLEDFSG